MKKYLRTKLVESSKDVEIIRNDEKSPLFSVKTFEELKLTESLLKGLYELGFQKPSKIQETVLPLLIANPPKNLIAQSQSGTGKTAAFLLASLNRVNANLNHPQVLILSPTLELSVQTAEIAKRMAKFTKIKIRHAIKGEVRPSDKIAEHVLIGTPGKMLDWSIRFKLVDLNKLVVFVLDEADVMIDAQSLGQSSLKLKQSLSNNCQMMLFSATYDSKVIEFAETIIPNDPIIIQLKREEENLKNITQYYVKCKNEDEKYNALANVFGTLNIGQTFIFCHTKRSAKFLKDKLEKDGHAVGLITGDLTVEERTEILKRFKEGNERVLITTNLMARGIDIEQVTVVINYDLPVNVQTKDIDYETYLHRIGRTGRFGKSGLAINLVDGNRTMGMIEKLKQHFSSVIKELDAKNIDEIEKIETD